MIRFSEVKSYLDKTINKLNNIIEKIKKYSKYNLDHRAPALVDEIKTRINQLTSAYNNVYSNPDFSNVYGENSNYDYTEYVNMLNGDVDIFEKIYQKIIKFESVFGYYNQPNEPEK